MFKKIIIFTAFILISLGSFFFFNKTNNLNDFYKIAQLDKEELINLFKAPNNFEKLSEYLNLIVNEIDKIDKEKLIQVAQNLDKNHPAFALDLAERIIFDSKYINLFGSKIYEHPTITYSSAIDLTKENIYLGDASGFLTIFNLKDNKVTKKLKIKEDKEITYIPDSMSFNPANGNIIAIGLSASAKDQDEKKHRETISKSSIIIFDLSKDQIIAELRDHKDHVKQVLFSNDGSLLASCSDDKTINIYTTKDWKLKYHFEQHDNFVFNISFNSDSILLASSAWDGKVIIWNLTNGKKQTDLELIETAKIPYYEKPDEIVSEKLKNQKITTVKFFPKSNNILASSQNNELQLININDNKVLKTFTGSLFPIVDIQFDNDSKRIAIVDENAHILKWSIQTQKLEEVFPGISSPYNKILFDKDNNIIFSYGFNFSSSFLFKWNHGLAAEEPLTQLINLIIKNISGPN